MNETESLTSWEVYEVRVLVWAPITPKLRKGLFVFHL